MTTINNETASALLPTKSYTVASIGALIIGSVSYCIGLFNAEMNLNEKGYYLIVLLYGLFAMISVQKAIRDEREGVKTSKIYIRLCWLSSGLAISLLGTGLYNAELLLSEKGFYAMAYTLSLFAVVVMQKNIRDSSLGTDEQSKVNDLEVSDV